MLMSDSFFNSEDQNLRNLQRALTFNTGAGRDGILGDWPEDTRGVPNSILRSALFGAIGRGKRAYNSGWITAAGDVSIKHTGPQLDQADLDVWEQCLHISRNSKLGDSVEFSVHRFLKAIGRQTGKSQREWLKESFLRLMTSVIEVSDGDRSYAGQLIHHHMRDDTTGLQRITINEKLVKLYSADGWTMLDWKGRLALRNHPLALWLHGFYSTHAKPMRYKVETIHKLCGSQSKNLIDFRKDLRKAFEVMNSELRWAGVIGDTGLITMTKPPSRSQQRHLSRMLNS